MTQPDVKTGSERAALQSMLFGYFPAQVLHVAVRLELAEHLADGPRSAAWLARVTGCEPGALTRLLRALIVIGVLEQRDPGREPFLPGGDLVSACGPFVR